MAPPSYNELFGLKTQEDKPEGKEEEISTDTPPQPPPSSEDNISISIDIVQSQATAPPPDNSSEPFKCPRVKCCARPNLELPRCPSRCFTSSNCLRSSRGCCDLNESCSGAGFIVTYVVGVLLCISNTCFGRIYSNCIDYSSYAQSLLTIGVLGFIYLALGVFIIIRRWGGHDEDKVSTVLWRIVGPFIILAAFYYGACTFYEWWMFRSCEPFAFSCTCGSTLLIYSMIFYSIGMIVAVPISLYIIFTICTKIPSFYKKIC